MDLFPIPMLREKTDLDIPLIKEEILKHRLSKPDNKEEYTSYYDSNLLPIDSADVINNCIIDYASSFISSIFTENNLKVDKDTLNVWYNVYNEGIHHCWHDHGRALLSGTIFIEMNETSSPFKIKSPLHALIKSWSGNAEFVGRFKQELSFEPEAGTIIMWPGWVEHNVPEQRKTNEPRITISFNIDIKR